jgi:hypothetical protein
MIQASEQIKHTVDAVSIVGVLATLAGWLPAIAALLSIVWSLIRIWETKTIQRWSSKFRKP